MARFRELDPEEFRGATVFLDIDGTLVPDGEETLDPAEAYTLSALTEVAQVYLLASKEFHRIHALAERYGAEAIVTAYMKPSPRIAEGIALPSRPRYVIGDKVLTDGWFASRIGARFVRVERLVDGSESFAVRALSVADLVLWAFISMGSAFIHSALWPYVRVARPPQWVKNFLMLLPLALSGGLFDPSALLAVVIGIVAFSASASVSYVVNDIIDCEVDRKNPTKSKRPIACGLIHVPNALFYAFVLAGVALLAAAEVPAVIPFVMGYLALTHVYTFYLKHIPVLELFAVSGFYVLRLMGGAASADIAVPNWLILVIFFSSLLAASGGRWAESGRPYPRTILARYPKDFLKLIPVFCAMMTLGIYTLAMVSSGLLFFSTVPVVAFAIIWYLRSVYRAAEGATDEERLWDAIALWAVFALLGALFFAFTYPGVV